jgi:hypothetical protein
MLLIPNVGAEEEHEWADPAVEKTEQASHPQGEFARAATVKLWQTLFAEGSSILGDLESGSIPSWPPGLGPRSADAIFSWLDTPKAAETAVAWLNTPVAERSALAEGRSLLGASPEVVREVHDKAFAHRVAVETGMLKAGLEELISVLDPELLRDPEQAIREIEERVLRWPAWTESRFTLKPRLGTSGRGRVSGVAGGVAECRGGFERLATAGGALLEPWLTRSCDLATQLWIGSADQLVLLGTAELVVDRSGLYRGHRGFVDSRGRVSSGSRYDEALRESAVEAAQAAAAAGYRGPCGVDAFAFQVEAGREVLRPLVEFNARFTLGIVAIGLLRRALPRIRRDLSLEPGGLRAFEFRLDAPPGGWPEELCTPGVLWIPLAKPDEGAAPGLLVAENRALLDQCLASGY